MEFTNDNTDIKYLKDNDLLKFFSEEEIKNIDKKYI
jgi:hypothetical protein